MSELFSYLEKFQWFGCVMVNKRNHVAAIYQKLYLNTSQLIPDFSLVHCV